MSNQSFNKNLRQETELLAVERERVDVATRRRFSYQLPYAFLVSLVFTMVMILLKGRGIVNLSDTIIVSLIGYTLAYIPVMLVIILKQLYSK
jgi:hypothetical protein